MTDKSLEKTLTQFGIKVVGASERVIKMRRVPTGPGFSKTAVNVMLMRQGAGQPFLAMLVDADLQYQGTNDHLISLFKEASCRNNWRILPLSASAVDPVTAVKLTLKLLGSGEPDRLPDEPVLPAPLDVLGREQELLTATSLLTTESARLLLIAGDAGVGKSALVSAVANRLGPRGWGFAIVNVPHLLAQAPADAAREETLARLIDDAARRQNFVLVLEQIQWLATLPLSAGVLSAARVPVAGTLPQSCVPWFKENVRHTCVVVLHGLDAKTSLAAVESRRSHLEDHHGIAISAECPRIAVERSAPMAGHLPGKAIALLDLACARAALENAEEVSEIHVLLAASDLEQLSA